MIRVKPLDYPFVNLIQFENLVNYDKSKTSSNKIYSTSEFENLVNYDKSKTLTFS